MERSSGLSPVPATCKPDITVVELLPEGAVKSPSVIYFPSCTRVQRCGGCCAQPLLSCQPVQSETLAFSVFKSEWNGNSFNLKNKEIVLVEQHTKCKCDCAVASHHCNEFQKYDKSQCACYCVNTDERDKCRRQDQVKYWDEKNCTCRCRNVVACTTETYFNENVCDCIQVPVYQQKKDQSTFDRKKFIIKAIPVVPNNFTKYETTN